ncbi:hypothetical protein [Terasakiella sp. SH-1]|uniref:hypothetical protein n=1 Tax=Terasakiella sp. SH-1 TaxID=2560057 RepID=UPI00142F9FA2|nr:hypothetical protein [Terasakiella sp. SH-1]
MKTLKTSCRKTAKKKASQCYSIFCFIIEGVRELVKFKNTDAAIQFYEEQIKLMETVHEEEMKEVEQEAVGYINERVQDLLKLTRKLDEQRKMYQELRDRAAQQLQKGYDKEIAGLKQDLVHKKYIKEVDVERRESNKVIDDLKKSVSEKSDTGKRYPTLSEYFYNQYMREKNLQDDNKRHKINYVDVFIKILGDKKLDKYEREDIVEYIRVLEHFPNTYGKSKYDKERTAQEVLKLAKENDTPTMSSPTIDKHISHVKSVFMAARKSKKFASKDDIDDLFDDVDYSSFVPGGKTRTKWSIQQLNELFQTPQWTGTSSQNQNKRYLEGKEIIRDSYWWLPVMALYTGARLEELAQLEHDDLKFTEDGTAYLLVHDEGERRVKTPKSKRQVPVHPDLIELDFLKLFKKKKKGKIFGDLTPTGRLKKYGETYSGHFTTYRRQCGIYERWRDFHSLRRTFITFVRNKTNMDFLKVAAIAGHDRELAIAEIQTEAYTDYDIDDLYKELSKLNYKKLGLKIDHLMK